MATAQSAVVEARTSHRTQIWVASIAGAAVVGAALVAPWPKLSSPLPPCTKKFEITEPAVGQVIDGSKGVTVKGNACRLDGKSAGWVFDYDPEDQTYYSVTESSIDRETWSAFDGPIGDKGDNNKSYTLVLIMADAQCNAVLEQDAAKDGGDTDFKTLPTGCVKADARNIVVSYK